jgi:hypothetical protein
MIESFRTPRGVLLRWMIDSFHDPQDELLR